jgi:hypothetical protein
MVPDRSAHTVDFGWVRYVYSADGQRGRHLGEPGFLPERPVIIRDCEPLEQVLEQARCLALTGDPGIGKSRELERVYDAHRGRGEHAVHIDAGKERDVAGALLRADELGRWRQAAGESLYIFIDSIDENPRSSRDVVGEVVADLARALDSLPREHVFVRLAWRTLVHDQGATQALQRLGQVMGDTVRVVELAPLRRDDARMAAVQSGIDAERFLGEIDVLGIEALASRPLTLGLLLELAGAGPLPARRAVLFERGCLRLCRWPEGSRRTSRETRVGLGRSEPLDAEDRLAVAMRVAAVTVLSQRPYVLIRAGAPVERNMVSAAEIAGFEPGELAGSRAIDVTTQMIVDTVVENGLFDGDGSRYAWVHQEYAHFLASRYLLRHGFSEQQIRSLLGYGSSADRLVLAPQLTGLAAWIDSEFEPAVRRMVIALDPVAQLRGDVASRSDQDKAWIVDELLDWYESERSVDPWTLRHEQRLAGLVHPGLNGQLRPVLRDPGKRVETRIAAAIVAGASQDEALMRELARIATDVAEPYALREDAAFWVAVSDCAPARRVLPALIDLAPEHDNAGRLRIMGLAVAWEDKKIDADTLFQERRPVLLSQWIRPSGEEIVERFGLDGLERALRWSLDEWDRIEPHWRERVGRPIWAEACKHLDEEPVVEFMAEVIDKHLRQHRRPDDLETHLRGDTKGRRALIERLLAKHANKEPRRAALELSKITSQEDASWLLKWFDEAADSDLRQRIGWLIRWSVPLSRPSVEFWQPSDERWLIVERYHSDEERYSAFRDYVICDVDSERAKRAREHWLQQQKREERAANKEIWTVNDITRWLVKAEAGDMPAWPRIICALTLADHEKGIELYFTKLINDDDFPGWKMDDQDLRARVVLVAERFLHACADDAHHDLRIAGIHALALLANHAPERLERLPAEIWQRWTPVLATEAYPPIDNPLLERLASLAKSHAASALIDTFRGLNDRYLGRWHALWTPELTPLLVERLTHPVLPATAIEDGLELLWLVAHERAYSVADQILNNIPRGEVSSGSDDERGKQTRERWVAAARVAVKQDTATYWPMIWKGIQADVILGKNLVSRLLHYSYRPCLRSLAPRQLSALYQWLMDNFPGIDQAWRQSGPDADERALSYLTETILGILKECKSMSALEALYELRHELPDDRRVRWVLPRAEENARRNDWEPPEPGQVLALAADRKRRLIHHSGQLQELVADIAGKRIPGVYPAVRRFWERIPGEAHAPVIRSSLPVELGNELDRILAGTSVREPITIQQGIYGDLRLTAGSSPGYYRRDIAVEIAILPNWLDDPVAELDALASKLDETDAEVHIIALIFWFEGEVWTRRSDPDPERRRRAMARSRVDLQAQLAAKARDIERSRAGRVHIAVELFDLSWSEGERDFISGVAWADDFLERLRAQGIEPARFCSLGDAQHWHVVLELPGVLQDRFDLAPHVLAFVCHGKLGWRDVRRARDELLVAHAGDLDADGAGELDPDVFVVVDDEPDLQARVERMPGRAGQLMVWAAADTATLEDRLALSLPRFDVFDVRTPVYGRQFIGRDRELADLQRRIMGGESCGVFGLRKSGKTSLVRRVIDTLDPLSVAVRTSKSSIAAEPRVLSVWLDVQGLVERSEENLWAALLVDVRKRLRAGDHEPPAESGSVYRDLDAALRAGIEDPRGPGQWCLVLDEADLLFESLGGEAGIPVVRLLRMLRAVAQETGRLSSVFIGRDSTKFYEPEMQGVQNPMLGLVKEFWLDAFSRDDADELLTRLSKRVGLELEDRHKDMALEWSGGHVILLRQFGSALLEVSRQSEGGLAAASDEAIVDAYLDREMVQTVFEETFTLLRARYPESYALLLDLLRSDAPAQVLAAHGGWIAPPARSLRNFRLLTGTAAAPDMPRWLRWYGNYLGVAPGTKEPPEPLQEEFWSDRAAR